MEAICSKCGAPIRLACKYNETVEGTNKTWCLCGTCRSFGENDVRENDTPLEFEIALDMKHDLMELCMSLARSLPKIDEHAPVKVPAELEPLVSLGIAPLDAPRLLEEINVHKWYMSERMGRDVGLRTAAIDYIENIIPRKCTG